MYLINCDWWEKLVDIDVENMFCVEVIFCVLYGVLVCDKVKYIFGDFYMVKDVI